MVDADLLCLQSFVAVFYSTQLIWQLFRIGVWVRFGLFSSAIAIVVSAVCAAGGASAATLTEVADVSGTYDCGVTGCLFSGTINDKTFSGYISGSTVQATHPDSYLDAVLAYNAYVQSNPGSGFGPLEISPIGETRYEASNDDNPNYVANNGLPADLADGFDPIVDPSGTQIGQVDFCTPDGLSSPSTICSTANSDENYRDGTWALTVDEPASYVAVDSQNHFIIYEIDSPSTSGTWSTSDISNDLSDPQAELQGLVLFAAVPEPATWAMFLLGFGMIGGSLRILRRKGAVATA
jgi:hypothetical protein